MKVPISQIRSNPFQVRKHVDRAAIEALAEEIKELGYWGGLRARKEGTHYELCFGHRRLEALKLLKVKEVDIELVKLSDDDMATQALVENLQREGLTDIEKAEGIQRLIARFEQDDQGNARKRVAQLIGLSLTRIDNLLGVFKLTRPSQRLIAEKKISSMTASFAKRLGGEDMIKTAADHQLPLHTLNKMSQELDSIAEPTIRAKVQRAIVAGKVRDAEAVREHERKLRRQEAERSGAKVPSDLRVVIRAWTQTMEQWTKQLDEVLPYLDYIEEDAALAAKFKTASRALIDKLKRFL